MEDVKMMESPQPNATAGSQVPVTSSKSLASSVLHNIFGRNGSPHANERSPLPLTSNIPNGTEGPEPCERLEPFESSPPVKSSTPSVSVRNILDRVDARKEKAAVRLGIGIDEVESLPFKDIDNTTVPLACALIGYLVF